MLKSIVPSSELPLFYIITNRFLDEEEMDNFHLFSGEIRSSNFEFVQIFQKNVLGANLIIQCSKLKQFKLLIVRPDFVIEYKEDF